MQQNKKQQNGKKSSKKAKLKPVGKTKYRNLKSNYTLLEEDEDIFGKLRSKKKANFKDDDDDFDFDDD